MGWLHKLFSAFSPCSPFVLLTCTDVWLSHSLEKSIFLINGHWFWKTDCSKLSQCSIKMMAQTFRWNYEAVCQSGVMWTLGDGATGSPQILWHQWCQSWQTHKAWDMSAKTSTGSPSPSFSLRLHTVQSQTSSAPANRSHLCTVFIQQINTEGK